MTRTGPDPALRHQYERLRERALGGISTAETSAGYGLLLRRGMLAWMRTCAACTALGELPAPVAAPASSTSTGLLLAPEGEAELVQVLTTLILSSHVTKQRPLIQ